jgi:glycosyltransferase involved in cell wall biosynthesis
MAERPFLSVITVSFNAAASIGDTLRSLKEQTCDDFESIVVDGGSSDGTEEVIRRFKETIGIYISEPDGGIYDAMNKGIRVARGEYLAFLNSDDAYFPDTVALVKEFAESFNSSIIYGNIRKERRLEEEVLTRIEKPFLDKMPETMGVFHPATFIARELFERFGGYDLRFKQASDYHWLLRAFLQGVDFGYLDAPLARFRTGGVSSLSCETYREAAIIQEELKTGNHAAMQALYQRCLAKRRTIKWVAKLSRWPIVRGIYQREVKKRWS